MKEHAIALSNLNDAKNASALGKFAGADYLLHVLIREKKAGNDKASIRLVEVATGQVKLEEAGRVGRRSGLVVGGDSRKGLGGPSPRVAGRQPSYGGHRRVSEPQRHRSQR